MREARRHHRESKSPRNRYDHHFRTVANYHNGHCGGMFRSYRLLDGKFLFRNLSFTNGSVGQRSGKSQKET